MLLQHGGDGDGLGEVEEVRVHREGGELDGGSEADEDLSPGVVAAVLACVCREDRGGGSSVEPAWVGRG